MRACVHALLNSQLATQRIHALRYYNIYTLVYTSTTTKRTRAHAHTHTHSTFLLLRLCAAAAVAAAVGAAAVAIVVVVAPTAHKAVQFSTHIRRTAHKPYTSWADPRTTNAPLYSRSPSSPVVRSVPLAAASPRVHVVSPHKANGFSAHTPIRTTNCRLDGTAAPSSHRFGVSMLRVRPKCSAFWACARAHVRPMK